MHITSIAKAPLLNSLGRCKGAEKAPEKIANLLNHQGFRFVDVELDKLNIENSFKIVFESIKKSNANVVIGGDHSVTFSCFKAFAEKHKNPGLLIFDAHPDCVNNFYPPTHEDFLRVLVEGGIVKPENVFLLGVRSIDPIELSFLKEKNISYITIKNIQENGIDNICDSLMEQLRTLDAFYLSIDIDVLDPAYAPGTSCIEPNGLTARELFYLLSRIKSLSNLLMFDIVEVNPEKDVNDITSIIAARIIQEIIK